MNANKIVTIICLILCIIALIIAPFCAIGAVEYSHTRTHEVAAVVETDARLCAKEVKILLNLKGHNSIDISGKERKSVIGT